MVESNNELNKVNLNQDAKGFKDMLLDVGKQLIDYWIEKYSATISKPKKEKKEETKTLKVRSIQELEKSYKLTNDKGLIGYVGKSTVENYDLKKNAITFKDNFKWVADKIEWKEKKDN